MILDSRITWEKLCIELELLSKEPPASVIPLLLGINSFIENQEPTQLGLRAINFMTYELLTQCEPLDESQRFEKLIEFFFNTKDFQISNFKKDSVSSKELLIKDVLSEKKGSALVMTSLFLHFAKELDLPITSVGRPEMCTLRWIKGAKSFYIDLYCGGKVLCEERLVDFFNRYQLHRKLNSEDSDHSEKPNREIEIESLSPKFILKEYLESLKLAYKRAENLDLAHAALSMLLKVEPSDLGYLAERALIRKELGHEKEALQDMKRYFSFSEFSESPIEIQLAYKEIIGMNQEAPSTLH